MADGGDQRVSPSCDVMSFKYIVIGGGIAGVTCAETVSLVILSLPYTTLALDQLLLLIKRL